jgi:serine/threonine-protein kinase
VNRQLHARAKEIFLEAAQLAANDRAGFLSETCGADTTLRAEVESLLQHHHPRTILAVPPDDRSADAIGGSASRRHAVRTSAGLMLTALGPRGQVALGALVTIVALALVARWYRDVAFGVGMVLLAAASAVIVQSWVSIARLRREVSSTRRLGQYTLEEQIGEGGMAQVFRATHAMLKRPTAVKLLKPGKATPLLLARFEREVQLASQLSHPNTIEIYDYGRTPEGTFYYVMEYLPGLTLAQLVRLAGALPPARAVHLLIQVCRSLREAHGLGLAHRDIKPQNIMVCRRGGDDDVIKVLDFGLVKSTDADGQGLSRTLVAGTPLYMAPERLLDPATTDLRSDLYSLGAVGYYLVVGQEVFAGESIAAIFDHVLHTPAPSAAQRGGPSIPVELDHLIAACLAKTPADRPANVAAVLETLETISRVEPWGQREARAWWDAHAEQVGGPRT